VRAALRLAMVVFYPGPKSSMSEDHEGQAKKTFES